MLHLGKLIILQKRFSMRTKILRIEIVPQTTVKINQHRVESENFI